MKKQELLEAAQKHGDLAFYQGYEAALRGILIEDREALSKMPEAYARYTQYQKIWEALKDKEVNYA